MSILLRWRTKISRISELVFQVLPVVPYYVKLFHSVRFNLKCESPRFPAIKALLFLFTYGGSTSKVYRTAHSYFVKKCFLCCKEVIWIANTLCLSCDTFWTLGLYFAAKYHRLGAEGENSVALLAKVPLPEVCVVFVLQLISAYQKRRTFLYHGCMHGTEGLVGA